MSLSIGIVGLPNVGKSTLFNALTKKQVEASNYPFCTIDPNIGVVKVPDQRIKKLSEISKPEKNIFATIEFIDIAGLVKGAHRGEGLGNQFLAHIRECDAICEVVRAFKDGNIIHIAGKTDPKDDIETINLELIFADLNTIDKRLEKTINKEAKKNDKSAIKLKTLLDKLKKHLEKGEAIRDIEINNEEREELKDLNLLTIKPIIYVLNIDDKQKKAAFTSGHIKGKIIEINAKLENEIIALPEDEQEEYIKELGLGQSGLDKLIKNSYELLDLITFFTTGPKETRAWTIKRGSRAPQAASVIHSDFEKNFIRAEAIGWQDLVNAGSEIKAKEKGMMRIEGRDYIIKDGDVCHFLINQ